MSRRLELITLPIRALVLLFLLYGAYYFAYGTPIEEWRKESSGAVVARYTRSGRPWRIFYDRDRDRQWDMWIDERAGTPIIVSIDDDRDGLPDRDEDEFGNPLSSWQGAGIRARKTFSEFVRNPQQWQYLALALMLYTLLELFIRSGRKSGT
jgi:hypothetical protein